MFDVFVYKFYIVRKWKSPIPHNINRSCYTKMTSACTMDRSDQFLAVDRYAYKIRPLIFVVATSSRNILQSLHNAFHLGSFTF